MAAAYIPVLFLIGMPLLIVFFLSRAQIGGPGYSIPGLSAMCGLFGAAVVGLVFFRDHGWRTWDRLRSSPATPMHILVGKALPLICLFIVQQALLLFTGWALFGMPWNGDPVAAALLVLAIVACEASYGMLLVSMCRTVEQLSAICYLCALIMAGIGGALAPPERLPDWINTLAPISPVFWMERGFQSVILGSRPPGDLWIAVLVLFAYAFCGAAVAVRRYRIEAEKSVFSH